MKRSNLAEVDASLFFEGMEIPGDLFYNYHNNYILLCSRCVLNAELMSRLQHCQREGWLLYVDKGDMDALLQAGKGRSAAHAPAKKAWTEPPKHLENLSIRMQIFREYKELVREADRALAPLYQRERLDPAFLPPFTEEVLRRLELLDFTMVLQCINMIRNAEEYTSMHHVNVAFLNGLSGKWLGYDEDILRRLVQTGFLIDIGRSRVPAHILKKPDKLTGPEYNLVKQHVLYSEKLAREMGVTDPDILAGIVQHHERVNGSGYPRGLTGEAIHPFAKISAIADAYDAMVANRSYRQRQSPFSILQEFSQLKHSQFDRDFVDVFANHIAEELTDKLVDLSNGKKGRVVHINSADYEHPIVKVGDEIFPTNDEVYCVSMSDFLSIQE